ncbi:GNAT family N-acetyltransferase [Streptomyces sp. NPDC059819]|uniref:GNAT family N-acetyltransferase n=1 Tax=Streptomyces sp. NPDC059819 TaxID=3346963 RepID=UPI003667A9D1
MNSDAHSPAASHGAGGQPSVRAATSVDAEAICRMRSAFVLSAPLADDWLRRCADELSPRLAASGDARAYVIDGPNGMLAACALGLVSPVLPAPSYPRGLSARVQLVATHPDYRRRGYARAVVSALLDRLADEDVTLFELHTSPEAAPLYRQLGFSGSPALMRMTRRSTSAPSPAASGSGPSWVPPEQHAQSLPPSVAFVCLYVTDEADRPLGLQSVYSPSHPWHMIGGGLDLGETPWAAAVRECREETGLTIAGPPRLLAIVYGPPRDRRPYSTVQFIFDGGRLSDDRIQRIVLAPDEHDEARFLPLDHWQELMPATDFARLRVVAEARRTGVAAYLDTWGNAGR